MCAVIDIDEAASAAALSASVVYRLPFGVRKAVSGPLSNLDVVFDRWPRQYRLTGSAGPAHGSSRKYRGIPESR